MQTGQVKINNKIYKFNLDGHFEGQPLTVNKSFDSKNKEIVKIILQSSKKNKRLCGRYYKFSIYHFLYVYKYRIFIFSIALNILHNLIPSSKKLSYSLENGASVAFSCVTLYCSLVNSSFNSSIQFLHIFYAFYYLRNLISA